jgi:hypothetical protein
MDYVDDMDSVDLVDKRAATLRLHRPQKPSSSTDLLFLIVTGLGNSAESQIAGNGQYEDTPLVEHERQPELLIKSCHNHFFYPPEPSTSITFDHARIIARRGLAMQAKMNHRGHKYL